MRRTNESKSARAFAEKRSFKEPKMVERLRAIRGPPDFTSHRGGEMHDLVQVLMDSKLSITNPNIIAIGVSIRRCSNMLH